MTDEEGGSRGPRPRGPRSRRGSWRGPRSSSCSSAISSPRSWPGFSFSSSSTRRRAAAARPVAFARRRKGDLGGASSGLVAASLRGRRRDPRSRPRARPARRSPRAFRGDGRDAREDPRGSGGPASSFPPSTPTIRSRAERLRLHATALARRGRDGPRSRARRSWVLFSLLVFFRAASLSRRPLAVALLDRVRRFTRAFETIVRAQIGDLGHEHDPDGALSLRRLPLFGVHRSVLRNVLVVTFSAGMIPVAGNLVSNPSRRSPVSRVSPSLGRFSLVFLVLVHKLEYLLNAKIVGGGSEPPPGRCCSRSSYSTPCWGFGRRSRARRLRLGERRAQGPRSGVSLLV